MQCYTELLPPSAVTHAVALPFRTASEEDLIVAKTSLLQVYKVRQSPAPIAHTNGSSNGLDARRESSKLCLVGEYALSGTVLALQRIKITASKSGGDALLIAFAAAKLSLVQWDPENHRISTVSIHYYEGENITMQPFGPDLRDNASILTVDPSSRCAALKFGQRHLAILPFRRAGDELAEADVDVDMDARKQSANHDQTNGEVSETPYKASFVSALTQIAPEITHPVDLAFLYEYREPTLGILSAATQPSTALLDVRKDILSYTAATLDLEQRASTVLVSVEGLPSDLWKVVPLPLPIGGALLVGNNELVHIDQGGKPHAVTVNEFAKTGSNFGMTDQSSLGLRLEDCQVAILDGSTGDALLVLRDGSMAVLSFVVQGRNVSGMHVAIIDQKEESSAPSGLPSCIAKFKNGQLFIGSDECDSTIIDNDAAVPALSRKRSHAQMLGKGDGAGSEDEDQGDDDLYGGASADTQQLRPMQNGSNAQHTAAYKYRRIDQLPCHGPFDAVCFGKSTSSSDKLQAVASIGRGHSSCLALLSRHLQPVLGRSCIIENATSMWNVAVKTKDSSLDEKDTMQSIDVLFIFDGSCTKAYDRAVSDEATSTEVNYIERQDTDFEGDGETVDIGILANSTRIVQCRQTEIRAYDANLSLTGIVPMLDEATDAELTIVATSFCDPYLLVLRDDSSVQVLQADKNGDIEPIEAVDSEINTHKWLSGCLYNGKLTEGEPAAFLLRDDGSLHAYSLPDLKLVYAALNTPHLPPVLYGDASKRRLGAKATLTEVVVADLGPTDHAEPYLVLRSASDMLTIYEPFHYPVPDHSAKWFDGLRFRKVPNAFMPKYEEPLSGETGRATFLRPLDIAGYKAIVVPSHTPSLLTRHAYCLPKVVSLQVAKCRALTTRLTDDGKQGLAVLQQDSTLQECTLPDDIDFGSGWVIKRLALGDLDEEVRHIAFHEERNIYVVTTCRPVDFIFTDDEGRHHDQDDIYLRPQVSQYSIHLLSATTHQLIHSLSLPYAEAVLSMKVMPLEASELTHQNKSFIVIGSAQQRGEDSQAKGAVSVFDILDVVPDPEATESGLQLHLVAREEPRGAVTAVENFAGGLIGTAQGQKIMIRGLKEDGSCLPVAFLDAQCQMVTLKSLGSTGFWLAGDIWKGIWFGGFTEEPFKLTVLGKSRSKMEVVCAEFLPANGDLYVLVVDTDMDLHVLQYDPENPKSLSGMRLLHRSTFHLGHWPTSMTLVPSTLSPFAEQTSLTNGHSHAEGDVPLPPSPLLQILITTQSGALGLITPLDEPTYRRLAALESHLTSILEHAAGLNPRDYRAIDSEGFGARGVIDGGIVQRLWDLGTARRSEVIGRAGGDEWGLRSDLEIIGGGGLGWL
ncbi:mRNA cleavage and polyadenylation factor subunit [Oleoguttula sp. CCFEE 5521]